MIRIGITGGLGMGKSTAAEILDRLGVPVVDTDVIAREVVAPGEPALAEIRAAFGDQMIQADGSLDRGQLATVVFRDAAIRTKLESILHPRIRDTWLKRLETWAAEGRTAGAVVIPLLFETAAETHFDAVVCLACSTATQRSRLIARGWSADQIHGRLAAQLPIEQKMQRAQFVIWTEPPPEVQAGQWKVILEYLRAHRRK